MKDAKATRIAKYYARTKDDEKHFRSLGVKPNDIYRGFEGQAITTFEMRDGELLGVRGGYLAFGSARKDWTQAEELVHAKGAAIYDLDTKMRSDRNGAKMVDYAITPRRTPDEYRAMQELSVAKRVKGRKKTRAHEKIWFNKKLSVKEKVELIGIPQATLYIMYKKTGVPAGRRKKT
jgi:DNA-binding Xre family transcriptional regulator